MRGARGLLLAAMLIDGHDLIERAASGRDVHTKIALDTARLSKHVSYLARRASRCLLMLYGRCVTVRARRTRVKEIGEFPDVRSGEQFQFRGIEE